MSGLLIQKQILVGFVLLCMIFTASIAQAMSLSMMLSADSQDRVSVSDVDVMPCHQVQVDTQSDQNKQRCNGCVDCQFCSLANAQAIQSTLLNAAFNWANDDYRLTPSPTPYSLHYPPAIRPPIV